MRVLLTLSAMLLLVLLCLCAWMIDDPVDNVHPVVGVVVDSDPGGYTDISVGGLRSYESRNPSVAVSVYPGSKYWTHQVGGTAHWPMCLGGI